MFFRIYFSLAGYKLVVFHPGRGGAGKGKRRFAPQGVWRSGGVGADVDPVVWLPRPGPAHRVPLPLPSTALSLRSRGRRMSSTWPRYSEIASEKTRFTHSPLLCQLAREFWGPNIAPDQRKANAALIEGIYQTLKKTKSVLTTCLCGRLQWRQLFPPALHTAPSWGWSTASTWRTTSGQTLTLIR